MKFRLVESKEDIQKFVDKFGQDTYDEFKKSSQRLKNNGMSTDIYTYINDDDMDKKKLDTILFNLKQKVSAKDNDITKIQGKYEYIGQGNGYKVYKPLDAIASMNLGVGTGWCTTGRYGHYGDENFKPSLKDAESHFNNYTSRGFEFYYFLDSKTMRGLYAMAYNPITCDLQIFDAKDNKVGKIPNIPKLKKLPGVLLGGLAIDSGILVKCVSDDKHIEIPNSVTGIGDYAFYHCTKLTSITIPSSVTIIGDGAFAYCTKLTSITIPDSVTSIGRDTFLGCTSLTNIVIPDSVTSIGLGTFYGCTNLTSITIPDSVMSIGTEAFYKCTGLDEITIPDSVTSIGDGAFRYCDKLTLYIYTNSYAEEYAKKNNIPYKIIGSKNESLNNKMRFRLVEDIASFKKRYPEIDDNTFNMLLKLDPTYTGGDNKGAYSQWIMDLYKRIKKQGGPQLRRFIDDDLYKVTNYLAEFDEKKKFFKNKDINQFKTLPDLAQALEEVGEGELSHRQEVRQRQKDRKNADLGKEAELVHEDSKWEVWVPNTYAASCKLGQGSSWCTASTESDYYYKHYLDMYGGEYYIIINKNDEDEKYQFHFESGQYMDKYDGSISLTGFLRDNEDLYEFFKPKIVELLSELLDSDFIAIYKSQLANNVPSRDMSKSFLMDVMHGDVFEYFMDNFGELPQFSWVEDEIDDENKSTILQIGKCDTLEECYEENDGIRAAIETAWYDGETIGSENACINDFEKAFNRSLPEWIKNPDNGLVVDDSSYFRLTANNDYINKHLLDVFDRLSDSYFEEYGIDGALCDIIGSGLQSNFHEPQYGWHEFDKYAFNDRLADELYGLRS